MEAKYVEHLLLRAPKKFDDPYQTMLYYQGLHIKYDRNRDGVGLKKASYYLLSERMGGGAKKYPKSAVIPNVWHPNHKTLFDG